MESHDGRTAEPRTQQFVDHSVALPELNHRERTPQDSPLGRDEPFRFSHWGRQLAVTCAGMYFAAKDAMRLQLLGSDEHESWLPVIVGGEEATLCFKPSEILFEWFRSLGSTIVYVKGRPKAKVYKEGEPFEMTPSSLAIRLPRSDAMLHFVLSLRGSYFRLRLNRMEQEEEIFRPNEGERMSAPFAPEDLQGPLQVLDEQRDLKLAAAILDRFEAQPHDRITLDYRASIVYLLGMLLGEAHALTRIAHQLEAYNFEAWSIAYARGTKISQLAARTRAIALVIPSVPVPQPGDSSLASSGLSEAERNILLPEVYRYHIGCEEIERISEGSFAGYTALIVRSCFGHKRYAILDTIRPGQAIYIFRVTKDQRWRRAIALPKAQLLAADRAETGFVMRVVHGPNACYSISGLLEQS